METELETLRLALNKINHPPGLVRNVGGTISGLAFFPAGDGNIGKDGKISDRPFMILGKDQDNEEGFKRTQREDREDYSATWRNMKELFAQSDIRLDDCFFTNAIMGIRSNTNSNIGKPPAFKDEKFMGDCLTFLKFQIQTQRPKVIICLGMIPARLLSFHAQKLRLKMLLVESFLEIDLMKFGVNRDVAFDDLDFSSTVVILTHPSYRKLNAPKRSFGLYAGQDPEVEMLKSLKQKK